MSGSGLTAAIGSTAYNTSLGGAVYVYKRTAGKYIFAQTLFPESSSFNFRFGVAVALSLDGGTLVVGADGVTVAPYGRASVYNLTAKGAYGLVQVLTASDNVANGSNANFGASLALSGDGGVLVVGSAGHTNGVSMNSGVVYLFVRAGYLYSQATMITSDDLANSDKCVFFLK